MKKIILYSIYSVCLLLMIGVLVGYSDITKNEVSPEILTDYDYVYDLFDNAVQYVNSESKDTVVRPFINDEVKIVKDFYDFKGDEKTQQNSIIYHDGIYMQNTGICYSTEKSFEVVAVLPGEVTEVLTDELVGNSITIKHDDNTYSVYQSVTEIVVNEGDSVRQGDKLALSGTSNINKDLNNHLYFELVVDGTSVNPEEYYDAEL